MVWEGGVTLEGGMALEGGTAQDGSMVRGGMHWREQGYAPGGVWSHEAPFP